jgi:hypothetical protein
MTSRKTRLLFVALLALAFGALPSSLHAAMWVPPAECSPQPVLPHSCWAAGTGNWDCTRDDLDIVLISPGIEIPEHGESELFENCQGCPEHKPSTESFSKTLEVSYTEPTPSVTLARSPMHDATSVTTALRNSIGHPNERSITKSRQCSASVLGCQMRLATIVLDVNVGIIKRMPHQYTWEHNNVTHGAIVFRPPPLTGICSICEQHITTTFPRPVSLPLSLIHSTAVGRSYCLPAYCSVWPCGTACY